MNKFIARHGKVAAAIVAVSTAVMLAGVSLVPVASAAGLTDAQIQSILSLLQSFGADTATVSNVNSALHGQATTATTSTASTPAGTCSFSRNLTMGARGTDVTCLQTYLISTGNYTYSGGATGYFGGVTKTAVIAWQKANSVSPASGYFGALSRAKYNAVVGVTTPTTPTTPGAPVVVAGDQLGVAKAATQPGDNLAPGGAARIPVTSVTFTAGVKDVTVNSITAQRVGLGTDASVKEVVLLGPDGVQVGNARTLASNHQTVLNEPFVVKAGTSVTYTVAFNRPATANEAGNVISISVVAVGASSPVVGTFPFQGAQITHNSTLTIGSVDVQKGVNDPGSSQTKQIGTTAYKFAALRLTAGSAEDVTVKSIRWYQAGSAGKDDLANVNVYLNDVAYPTTVSADGKYYTAKFGDNGYTLAKGNQVEVYIKGDVVNGTNRTVIFDLFKYTDLNVQGAQFGFGLTPASSGSTSGNTTAGSFSSDTNPAYTAYTTTIGVGTITVTQSTAVAAQNIAVNLDNQPLGAFDVEVKGEPITVSSIVIRLAANQGIATSKTDYTNVALYDSTGTVVAGPKDGTASASSVTFTYTDAVTFPVGKGTYILKGKLASDFTTNALVAASTTPSSDWTSATGRVSGNSITPASTGTLTGNSMTVKSGAVTVSLGNSPTEQSVIRGVSAFTMAHLIFDATASGEDVRFTSAKVALKVDAGNTIGITNCQLYDGTTALNTGSNVINPAKSDTSETFTLDTNLTIPKGTAKDVALKCDVPASGLSNYVQWTLAGTEFASISATGLVSGNTITPSVASSSATNKLNFSASGTLAVALDASSPSVRLAQAGQEVTLGVLKFTSTNEDMNVKKVELAMTGTASTTNGSNSSSSGPNAIASSTVANLVQINLYDPNGTLVGSSIATSTPHGMTASLTGFTVPANTDKTLTIKGQLAPIGVSQVGGWGQLVRVDFKNDVTTAQGGNNQTYAVGMSSSQNVYATGSATASGGVRLVRSYPTVQVLALPSNTLSNSTGKAVYRFSISAPAGGNGISLYRMNFSVSTTTVDLQQLELFGFSDSAFSQPAYGSNGQLNNGSTFDPSNPFARPTSPIDADLNNAGCGASCVGVTSIMPVYFNPVNLSGREAIVVPAGTTRYFELRSNITNASAGDSATIRLLGDNAFVDHTAGGTNSGTNLDASYTTTVGTYSFASDADTIASTTSGQAGPYSSYIVGVANTSHPGNNFVWSDNATTTVGAGNRDWFNGFQIPGLPSGGASAATLSL